MEADSVLDSSTDVEVEVSDRTMLFYEFLEQFTDFLINHGDLPQIASNYRDWKKYKEAVVKFIERVNWVFHQVVDQTGHLQVEVVDEEDADSRLLLEGFLGGVADLISFLVKASLLPFDVKATPLSRDKRRFREEIMRLIREM